METLSTKPNMLWPLNSSTRLLLLIAFIPVSYCGNQRQRLENKVSIGRYKSKKYSKLNFFDSYPGNIKKYAVGAQLDLLSNNRFVYSTCANVIEGTWSVEKDTLFLFCLFNEWKDKAYQTQGFHDKQPDCSPRPIKFIVNQDELFWIYSDSMKGSAISILKAVDK